MTFVIALINILILSVVYQYLKSNFQEQTYQRIRSNLARENLFAKTYLESRYSEDF